MLVVDCNKKQFEYDIHSIVKAFFPEESVKVISLHTFVLVHYDFQAFR